MTAPGAVSDHEAVSDSERRVAPQVEAGRDGVQLAQPRDVGAVVVDAASDGEACAVPAGGGGPQVLVGVGGTSAWVVSVAEPDADDVVWRGR